jgi:hypothetical protein
MGGSHTVVRFFLNPNCSFSNILLINYIFKQIVIIYILLFFNDFLEKYCILVCSWKYPFYDLF